MNYIRLFLQRLKTCNIFKTDSIGFCGDVSLFLFQSLKITRLIAAPATRKPAGARSSAAPAKCRRLQGRWRTEPPAERAQRNRSLFPFFVPPQRYSASAGTAGLPCHPVLRSRGAKINAHIKPSFSCATVYGPVCTHARTRLARCRCQPRAAVGRASVAEVQGNCGPICFLCGYTTAK